MPSPATGMTDGGRILTGDRIERRGERIAAAGQRRPDEDDTIAKQLGLLPFNSETAADRPDGAVAARRRGEALVDIRRMRLLPSINPSSDGWFICLAASPARAAGSDNLTCHYPGKSRLTAARRTSATRLTTPVAA